MAPGMVASKSRESPPASLLGWQWRSTVTAPRASSAASANRVRSVDQKSLSASDKPTHMVAPGHFRDKTPAGQRTHGAKIRRLLLSVIFSNRLWRFHGAVSNRFGFEMI